MKPIAHGLRQNQQPSLLPRLSFHAAEGQWLSGSQFADEAFDRVVAASKPMITDQILVDPLGR